MTNYFDKKDVEGVRRLNAITGMKHRDKPFDFNNPKDLHEALMYAAGAFADYSKYASALDSLLGDFDESIEHFDTATWNNFTKDIDNADSLYAEGYNALEDATSLMSDIAHRAEKHCKHMLKIVLNSPADLQAYIFGKSYNLSSTEIDEFIETLFENYDESNFKYSVEDSVDCFIKIVNDRLP